MREPGGLSFPQALKEKAEEIDLLASVDEYVDRVLEEACLPPAVLLEKQWWGCGDNCGDSDAVAYGIGRPGTRQEGASRQELYGRLSDSRCSAVGLLGEESSETRPRGKS